LGKFLSEVGWLTGAVAVQAHTIIQTNYLFLYSGVHKTLLCEVRIIYLAFCPQRFMERKITQIFSLTYLPGTHLFSSFIRRYFRHKRKETVFFSKQLKMTVTPDQRPNPKFLTG
jgi:hypothetical protein